MSIGRRRKGIKRFGTAHGIRFNQTMETIVTSYSRVAGVTFSDAVRLLLEQAIGRRVSAVDAQAERLGRIEDKIDEVLAILAKEETVEEELYAQGDTAEMDRREYYEDTGWKR